MVNRYDRNWFDNNPYWRWKYTSPDKALLACDTDKDIVVTKELPGVNPNDVQVKATADTLDIKTPKWSGQYTLSSKIDHSKVKATLKYGVLTITMPKAVSSEAVIVAVVEE